MTWDMQQIEQLKAFLKITKHDMTDAGMSIADANAILAEVGPDQGELH